MGQTTLFDFEISPAPKVNLPYLSYSKINEYQQCPLKYKYHYILKIPQPPNKYLSFGKSIHETLDIFAKKYKDNFEKVELSDLMTIYAKSWLKEGYLDENEEKDYWELGKNILANFLELTKKTMPKIVHTEKRFIIDFDGFKLSGVIDRIDERNNEWVIIDYKTGKEESVDYMKQDLQLPIYSLAVQKVFGKIVQKVGRIYLKTLNEAFAKFEDYEIEESKELVQKLGEKIIEDEVFEPKESALCNYCDYRTLCPKMQNNK